MLRGLYIFLVYLAFLVLGASAPFILSLGYVWVDMFDPQDVASFLLGSVPVSLIMGVAAIFGAFAAGRLASRPSALSILLLVFAAWVTFTTAALAESPVQAWIKWNYAFKTLCFGAFLPFVFRTRVQMEAFLQILLFALLVHILPIGIKTMISGGGYGRALGVLSGNSLMAEGSTLSAVALMLVPIALYLRTHGLILPRRAPVGWMFAGIVIAAVAAAIGTFERTGLVGIAVVGIGLWLRSRRKILYSLVGACALAVIVYSTSSAWNERVSTITQYNTESSALGRILVWQWTLGYVAQHPLGGGFNSYVADTITFPPDADGNTVVRHGVAFHSIYFEVLGEQGYVGLGLFFTIIGLSLVNLQRAASRVRGVAGLEWARALAYALQISLITLLCCGSFIGIAFQPMLYYLFGIAACLWQHVRRVQPQRAAAPVPDEAVAWQL